MKSLFLALTALAFIAQPARAQAPVQKWIVDSQASSITFKGTHADNEFTGTFKSWTADIAFDPKNLEASTISVSIDTASAETGDKTYDSSLPSAEWMNPKAFPTATFTSKAFRQTGDETYEVDGTVTLKGVSADITMPFTLSIKDDTATVEAETSLDRLTFDMGKESDPKGEWVSPKIGVAIELKATKAP